MPEADDPARSLEARALALLARREYTRAELARRLARLPAAAHAAALRRSVQDSAAADLADEFAPPPPAADRTFEAEGGAADQDPGMAPVRHSAIIESLLDALTARGMLSDARAAEAIVHAHARRRGLMRVRQELEHKGVPEDVAAAALEGLAEQQIPLAREVWRKRFGVLPGDFTERARQTRFLAARGFSFEVIRAVLGGDPGE